MEKIAAFLIVLMLMGTGCSQRPSTGSGDATPVTGQGSEKAMGIAYQKISPSEAKNRLASEAGIVLLDVRTPEEYEEKHIPNSLLIPLDELEEEAAVQLADQNATIFVYCRSGRRSATAAKWLNTQGYRNVYDLGGILDWPYEVER
ncbi:rhodanese-like domain-containing protein [Heliophilum fasciatum]|uniref:Rhodanese-related sulfurtransferase n=1 Tax=Heliophilum fasciatum TaxID=35700 RepID=A0A4R2RNU0_9FIRM|nr:rhodanese-like domain-containing protein [Heliophilum fasciatum]MCW2278202.1 rhodanese-related sulfurtransferase [Heliophilum fasciatum]TCP63977.1 rhodanese-related sulfurtransferase [Heliophilum fasciatum]